MDEGIRGKQTGNRRRVAEWERDSREVAELAIQHRFPEADALLARLKRRPYGNGLGFGGWAGFFEQHGDTLGDGDRVAAAWFYQTAVDACAYYVDHASDSADHLAGMQSASAIERKLQTVQTDPKFRMGG